MFLNSKENWDNSSWASNMALHLWTECSIPTFHTDQPKCSTTNISVDARLSEKVDSYCALAFSPGVCLTVIICNIIKLAAMILCMQDTRSDVLITVGDAIASFLTRPNQSTRDKCWTSKSIVSHKLELWRPGSNLSPSTADQPARTLWCRRPDV